MSKNNSNFPYSSPIKKLKDDFKRMVDEMPDEEFVDMMNFLIESDEDDMFDEDAEDDFYEDEID